MKNPPILVSKLTIENQVFIKRHETIVLLVRVLKNHFLDQIKCNWKYAYFICVFFPKYTIIQTSIFFAKKKNVRWSYGHYFFPPKNRKMWSIVGYLGVKFEIFSDFFFKSNLHHSGALLKKIKMIINIVKKSEKSVNGIHRLYIVFFCCTLWTFFFKKQQWDMRKFEKYKFEIKIKYNSDVFFQLRCTIRRNRNKSYEENYFLL